MHCTAVDSGETAQPSTRILNLEGYGNVRSGNENQQFAGNDARTKDDRLKFATAAVLFLSKSAVLQTEAGISQPLFSSLISKNYTGYPSARTCIALLRTCRRVVNGELRGSRKRNVEVKWGDSLTASIVASMLLACQKTKTPLQHYSASTETLSVMNDKRKAFLLPEASMQQLRTKVAKIKGQYNTNTGFFHLSPLGQHKTQGPEQKKRFELMSASFSNERSPAQVTTAINVVSPPPL